MEVSSVQGLNKKLQCKSSNYLLGLVCQLASQDTWTGQSALELIQLILQLL